MLEAFVFLIVVATWAYWLVACWLVRDFVKERRKSGRRFTSPVSILKPVKGLDAQAYENFASFCRQDYPDYELVFGIADADDPVIPVIERLKQDFPERDIRLYVAPATHVNRKASLLHFLAARARHDTLVVSDSDMRVTPDYLQRVVAPLAEEGVGLVSCLYRGQDPVTFTARLEALHMGVTFLPSVLVARRFLNMRFALGATMALRRRDLARIGGFAAVGDYLADDYQVGVRIADLGLQVHLSDYVVNSVLGPTTFREQWDREVRWAHCTRVSRPLEYPGLLLTFSTPVAVILGLLTGFDLLASISLVCSLLLRWLVAWVVTGFTENRPARRWFIWLPLRDMLSALVWCAGAVSQCVVWRGERYVLQPGGRLRPLPPDARCFPAQGLVAVPQGAVRWLDALLQQLYGIQEFCHDQECILRVSLAESDSDMLLSDGTQIRQRQPIAEIHFRNEFLPPIPEDGATLAWARAFIRQLAFSLTRLAIYVQRDPDYRDIQAFRGENSFVSRYLEDRADQIIHWLGRWGFDVVLEEDSRGLWQRFARFGANVYALALIWAFNSASLKRGGLWHMERSQLWMSRNVLLSRYGAKVEDRVERGLGGEQSAAQAEACG